jgi:RNase P/RNase MRP subunit POP5
MATRERNRYVVCHILTEKYQTGLFKADAILYEFRQNILSNWGELGLASFGTNTKLVASFANSAGIFIVRFPSKFQSECLLALSSIFDISSRPVTVRNLHISGKLKNAVKYAIDELLSWRNRLPPEFAIPRKDILDTQLREHIQELLSLPDYV